jgi:hypothetical protein
MLFLKNGFPKSFCGDTSFDEIEQIKENAIPQNTKMATKFGVKLFKGKKPFAINLLTTFLTI